MKIAVIGGGIFGVTAAFTLSKHHNVELFEKNNESEDISLLLLNKSIYNKVSTLLL